MVRKRNVGFGSLVLGIAIALVTTFFAPTARHTLAAGGIPKMMTWTAYEVGSTVYYCGSLISQAIYEKHGTKIRIIPARGDIERFFPVRLKDAELAITGIVGIGHLQEGIEEFASMQWGPLPTRLLYSGMNPGLTMISNPDAGIRTPADMKGKRIPVYPSGTLNRIVKCYLAFGDLTWDDVKKVNVSGAIQASRMCMEGKLDASIANVTQPIMYEFASQPAGVHYIPLPSEDKEGWARLQKIYPAFLPFKATVGAGVSPEKPAEVITYPYPCFVAFDFLPSDKAYWITKLLWETYPLYAKKAEALKNTFKPEIFLSNFDRSPYHPLHEGSIRYLKEIGKWTAEREERNRQTLERQARLKKLWDEAVSEAVEKKIKAKEYPKFWLEKRVDSGF